MAKKNKGINIFQSVPKANPNRTQFPIHHKCDFSGDFGNGYPIFCQEVIPGDLWHVAADHFSRLAPMIAPVYHEFDVKMHWFFVPMRLLWDDFEDWMTGGKNGTWREDNPDAFPLFPLAFMGQTTDNLIGTLVDFLGVNTAYDGTDSSVEIRSDELLPVMPLRGYWLIYNYFFRDQNVTDEVEISLASGVMGPVELSDMFSASNSKGFFTVAWDKDYFTSATLSPQRGPQVYIPLGSSAPVTITNVNANAADYTGDKYTLRTSDNARPSVIQDINIENITWRPEDPARPISAVGEGRMYDYEGRPINFSPQNLSAQADLSAAEGAAVDDVREAFALQRFFERMQVVGSRFAEFLRGIWGTNAGDARLQMPEYLGTWRNPFMINNVSNTTGTTENPQAGYAGNGMSSEYNKAIHKYFPEYGYLYCIYSAVPRTGYQQGLAPIFCRRDWLHFANPFFEHIGEQPIEMEEIYYDPSKMRVQNEETFGYQSQYASYKFINSHSHGEFKKSLNFWHANRIFDSKPTLSREFIEFNKEESTDRVFVIPDEPKFYTTVQFDGYVERNLSAYSTPRLM